MGSAPCVGGGRHEAVRIPRIEEVGPQVAGGQSDRAGLSHQAHRDAGKRWHMQHGRKGPAADDGIKVAAYKLLLQLMLQALNLLCMKPSFEWDETWMKLSGRVRAT